MYGLDGRLLGAPAMERTHDFDKKDWGLPNLAVEVWQGFVFVNFDRDAAPLAPTLARYEPFLEHYDLADCVCPGTFTLTDLPWNWKVMFENFNDGYHANRLHQIIQDFCPSQLAAFPVPWDDASNVIFRTNGYTHIDGGFNATTKALLPGLPRPDRGGALALDLRARASDPVPRHRPRPGLLLHRHPQDGRARSTSRSATCCTRAPSSTRCSTTCSRCPTPACRCSSARTRTPRPRCSGAWAAGSRSRGRYSWQEESHVQFNRWLVQRYRKHYPIHHEPRSNGGGGA